MGALFAKFIILPETIHCTSCGLSFLQVHKKNIKNNKIENLIIFIKKGVKQ
jgi:hypothetical protein